MIVGTAEAAAEYLQCECKQAKGRSPATVAPPRKLANNWQIVLKLFSCQRRDPR